MSSTFNSDLWSVYSPSKKTGGRGVSPWLQSQDQGGTIGWTIRRLKGVFKRLDVFILKSHPLFWDIFMPVLEFQCAKCFLVGNENDLKKKKKQNTKNSSWVLFFKKWKVKVLVTQSCGTLCDPMDSSPPGSSVHGILQGRILEWVASPFSRGSSWPKDQTLVFYIARRLYHLSHQGRSNEII